MLWTCLHFPFNNNRGGARWVQTYSVLFQWGHCSLSSPTALVRPLSGNKCLNRSLFPSSVSCSICLLVLFLHQRTVSPFLWLDGKSSCTIEQALPTCASAKCLGDSQLFTLVYTRFIELRHDSFKHFDPFLTLLTCVCWLYAKYLLDNILSHNGPSTSQHQSL